MGGSLAGIASGCGLAGSLSFVGGFNDTRGLLIGGPPVVFKTRGAFGGTLTAGNGGGASMTGVLGI